IHSLWVQHNLDAYLVGSPEVKDRLAENGIDPIRIHVTGIPINPAFVKPKNIVSIKRKIGLTEEKPVLLVMGGGLGMGRFTEIVRLLDQAPIEIQVIAITGKNQALKEELDRLAGQQVKSLRVFGYVSNVEEFMAAADLIITKPGGLTSSEALAVGLPMVLVNPLPGQEEYNCMFLVEKGAAVKADTPDSVPRIVTTLFREPDKMMRMRQNALALGRPAASLDAAKLIMKTGKRKDYLYAQGTCTG
ncbi:MAG: glycosyltransferase, partial [Bacillota bacterium]